MTHDVQQWLNEIKALQQKMAELAQERDEAHATAEHWRELYNTEAQQRRTEAKLAQQTIASLKLEMQRLQAGLPNLPHPQAPDQTPAITQKVEAFLEAVHEEAPFANLADSSESAQLKTKLSQLFQERDGLLQELTRLSEALKAEQQAHRETRQSLTTALGDTMDRLKAAKTALTSPKGSLNQEVNSDDDASVSFSIVKSTKIPSLQLPPLESDQSPA
jgi:seryl-tRNA synthetase